MKRRQENSKGEVFTSPHSVIFFARAFDDSQFTVCYPLVKFSFNIPYLGRIDSFFTFLYPLFGRSKRPSASARSLAHRKGEGRNCDGEIGQSTLHNFIVITDENAFPPTKAGMDPEGDKKVSFGRGGNGWEVVEQHERGILVVMLKIPFGEGGRLFAAHSFLFCV